MKSLRQDVQQKAANELVDGQRHRAIALGAVAAVILVAEGDAALVKRDQPAVRDRDPVRVARQVGQHRPGSGERRFGIDDPGLLADRRQVAEQGRPFAQGRLLAVEVQAARGVQFEQPGQEQPAEQFSEHTHRQQKGRSGRHPALTVERDATAGHDHVDVRMVRQRRTPAVEHGGDADARAKMAAIGGDDEHGLRRRAEQQVVDRRLVLQRDVGDFGG